MDTPHTYAHMLPTPDKLLKENMTLKMNFKNIQIARVLLNIEEQDQAMDSGFQNMLLSVNSLL